MQAMMLLETLMDDDVGVRDHWLPFLTLEDIKTLSSTSSSARFATLRRLVVERAVWRLPYPPQWRSVNGVRAAAQEYGLDSDRYESTTYLGTMDKHSIRKVSVPREAVLEYVVKYLPNVTSIRTWKFNGEVVGTYQTSLPPRRIVYERQQRFDFHRIQISRTLKELLLNGVQVPTIHRLASFSSLESLEIALPVLRTGTTDFEALTGLVELKSFHLKHSRLVDFNRVQGFTQLTSLDVSSVVVSSLDGIDSVPALQTLRLVSVQSENAIVPLRGLTRLQHLQIERLGPSDAFEIQLNAPDLESCWVRNCGLLHLDFLFRCPKLRDLELREIMCGGERTIPSLPYLERLVIAFSPSPTRGFNQTALPPFPELHTAVWYSAPLAAGGTPMDGSFFEMLSELRALEIHRVSEFSRIPSLSLKSLVIRRVEAADEYPIRELIHTNKQLQVLHLYATSPTNFMLRAPHHAEYLLELHLVHIALEDVGVFQYFTRLRRLSISGMSYKHSFRTLTFLRDLTSLKSLAVTRNPDFADISVLTSLSKLEHLDLQYTKVKDVNKLARLTALQELDLCGTPVGRVDCLGPLKHLRRIALPRDVSCAVFQDSGAFPMLQSIVHEGELDCCTNWPRAFCASSTR